MKCFIALLIVIFSIISVKSEKIIIVGAGASGLAAATRLIENNITDFIILEAEKRLGGRIHSIDLSDENYRGQVDLGGEYVGGEEGNVVFQFAKKELRHTDPRKRTKVVYSNGEVVNPSLSKEIFIFKENLRNEFIGEEPISIADAFSSKYNSTVLEKYKNDQKQYQIALDFIGTCKNIFLYRLGAFDWSNVLLNDHYEICKGDQGLNWNGKGYRHFLDLLIRKFGDEHRLRLYPIYYSKTIEKIIWNDGRVKLETNNGYKYEAEHVIFTPSVGVLKAKHEELFDPKLPSNKVDAIMSTGFDAAMKVIMQYPEKWWDDSLSDFLFVWNNEDAMKVSNEYPFGPKKDGMSWLISLSRIFTVTSMPNVLIGWFTGPLIPDIEKLEIEEIKKGVVYIMKFLLGKEYNMTEPRIVIPSTWYTNSNFRGVYSYEMMPNGRRKRRTQEDLAEPLLNNGGVPVVLFAGEHTHITHFSSVHGAVESGYRAANELISYLNKN